MQHRLGAAGIGEGCVAELHPAAHIGSSIEGTVGELRRTVQHLLHALPGGRAPGDVLEQHGQLQYAVEQLGGVGDRCHDAARGAEACAHLRVAQQQDQRHHHVHQRVHRRVHEGEDGQHLQLGLDLLAVGLAEAQLLIGLPHAGLDDADAGNVLLQYGVDPVQMALQAGEQRVGLQQTQRHAAHDDGEGAQHHQAEARVQAEHEEDAAEHQHAGADHSTDEGGDVGLHLGDVVGHARHQ